MALRGGTAFQAADRTREPHLWVVLSDPETYPHHPILIANLTSWRSDKDSACILGRGDHPFVQRKTCVNYRDSRLVPAEKLQKALDQGMLIGREPVDDQLLRRLRQGAGNSRFIPLGNLQLLKDQGLVE